MPAFLKNRTGLITFAKAATIADYKGIQTILNVAGFTLGAGGVTIAAASASGALITCGGMPNMRITASMKYIAPTVAGGEDLGVVLHWGSNVQAADRNYIMFRQHAGVAKITEVAGGTGTTRASATYALAQDTYATFILERIGSAIRAKIDSEPDLTATITTGVIPAVGCAGFRCGFSVNSTMVCRDFTVEMWR